MLFLSRADVERLLSPQRMFEALENGFRSHSVGATSGPPRTAARGELGLLGAMPGWVADAGLAIKAVTVFPDNVASNKPSHQGVIVLFDEGDGAPLCVMDAEHITAMRTAGAAAIAVRVLARDDSRVLAILGAGVQGTAHLAMVPLLRSFASIRIASRTREHAARLAAQDQRCTVAESFEAAVRDADVVCCCTDARTPIIHTAWLSAGAHVSSVGGTFGPELTPDLVAEQRVFVEWRGAAQQKPPAGAHELQGHDPQSLTELGEVLSGVRPGRTSNDEVTVYKSTGVAFEDVVVARIVYDAALTAHAGVDIDLS